MKKLVCVALFAPLAGCDGGAPPQPDAGGVVECTRLTVATACPSGATDDQGRALSICYDALPGAPCWSDFGGGYVVVCVERCR